MRILVCGDRKWADWELIRQELIIYPADTIVIQGAAPGADSIGAAIAEELFGLDNVLSFRADWTRYGRAAGPVRNKRMLTEGKPDLVIAFHDDIDKSKGTKHMLSITKKAGIPWKLISHQQ